MQENYDWIWMLDPDQLQALNYLRSEAHSIVSVSHSAKQDSLIIAWTIDKLLSGEDVILAIGDPLQQKRIYTLLHQLDLSSATYLKNQHNYYPALQLARKQNGDAVEMKNQQFVLATAQQKMKNWASRYQLLHQPVFESLNWRDLADRLASHPLGGIPNILHLKLNPTEFERNADEYKLIRSKLSNYIKLCKLNHPWFDQLKDLNVSHLKQFNLEVIKKEVTGGLSRFTIRGEELIRSGEVLLLDFIKYSKHSLQSVLKDSHQKISGLLFKMDNYEQLLGPEFSHETSFSNFTTKLKSSFTRNSKDLIRARRWMKSAYMDLLSDLDILEPYVSAEVLIPAETISMEAIRVHLMQLAEAMNDCEQKMQSRINEQIRRLNSKNLPSDHPLSDSIKTWESQLSEWKKEMDHSQFFSISSEVNALSVQKKLNIVSQLVRQLREMRRASEKLEDYIFWRSFEDNIPSQCRKVIAALEFEDHKRWLDLFDQWYFMSTLEQHTLAEMPESSLKSEIPRQLSKSATKAIIQNIKLQCQSNRFVRFKSGNQLTKKMLGYFRKKDELGIQNQLEHIGIEARNELFPVQIVSPQSFMRSFGAESIKNNIKVLFILDDASMEVGTKLVSTTLKSPCHIITFPAVANRLLQTSQTIRKNNFHLTSVRTGEINLTTPIDQISSSEKLKYLKQIASMFEPLLHNMAIYNTRYLQIFSFLGPKLEAWLLDELELPYKIHNEGLAPNAGFIVECLLDQKKPIVFLLRDGLFSTSDDLAVNWQIALINQIRQLGFPLHQSWSVDWMDNGHQVLAELKEFIFHKIPGHVHRESSKSA